MPDKRTHRGPHPEDARLFARENCLRLREATRDLSWLLTRGYVSPSALKIVGDRYSLEARQRVAIARCACADDAVLRRQRHQVRAEELEHHELWIDGYNVLTSIEAALSGCVVLHARDGCYRDMASMHGCYRKVSETVPAMHIAGELLKQWNAADCRWLLDQPVSNSGRLKLLLQEVNEQCHWSWRAELVPNPDNTLLHTAHIVATSDSHILDQVQRWFNFAKLAIDLRIPEAWIVDLSS